MEKRMLEIAERAGITHVKVLRDKIYQNEVPVLRETLIDLTESMGKRLVLNLENVEIINSSGLGVLILVHDRLSKTEGKLVVTGLTPILRELFDQMKLQLILHVAENEEDILRVMNE